MISFILILQLILPTSVWAGDSQSDAQNRASFRLLKQKYQSLKAKTSGQSWFRANPDVQSRFNFANRSLNLYQLLSENQKQLLKSKSSDIKRALEIKNIGASFASSGIEVVKLYVLVWSLTLIGMAEERSHTANVTNKDFDRAAYSKEVKQAIAELADSGEIINSMVSAGLTHWAFKPILSQASAFVNSLQLAAFLKTFIVTLANTLISFGGWEFGAQLWKESTNLLDSQLTEPEEVEFLKTNRNKLWTSLFHSIAAMKTSTATKEDRIRQKILFTTVENLVDILSTESKRMDWLYNALRLRIYNGSFAITVTAMSTVNTAGAVLAPAVAATLWGSIGFGLLGGAVTLAVPDDQKYSLTQWMKDQYVSKVRETGGTQTELKLPFLLAEPNSSAAALSLENGLLDRVKYRESLMDVYMEKIFTSRQVIQKNDERIAELNNQVSEILKNGAGIQKEIGLLVESNLMRWQVVLDALARLASLQLSDWYFFLRIMPAKQNPFFLDIESQVFNAENLYNYFCTFASSILIYDFGNLQAKFAAPDLGLGKLKNVCQREFSVPKNFIAELKPSEKKSYDSAIRFIDRYYWSKIDEVNIALESLSATQISVSSETDSMKK